MKRIKKICALLLSVSLLLAPFTGCGKSKTSLSDDTLVMKVADLPVYWNELYYWMYAAMSNILYYEGVEVISDWDAVFSLSTYEEATTYAEYVVRYAEDAACLYRTIESRFGEMGLTLNEEDVITKEYAIENYGYTEETFAEYLEGNYLTEELFNYFQRISVMYSSLLEAEYGKEAADFPDNEVAEYVEEYGYLQAKHILFLLTNESGEEYSDEEKAERKSSLEELLTQLKNYSGDDLEGYFDELIVEYGEDPGMETSPDGYLFYPGTMMEEFEETTKALDTGKFSDIVETAYGYHIILRLQPDYDAVPYQDTYSLRYAAAESRFASVLENWKEAAKVVYEDVYDTIVPSEVFAAS